MSKVLSFIGGFIVGVETLVVIATTRAVNLQAEEIDKLNKIIKENTKQD